MDNGQKLKFPLSLEGSSINRKFGAVILATSEKYRRVLIPKKMDVYIGLRA